MDELRKALARVEECRHKIGPGARAAAVWCDALDVVTAALHKLLAGRYDENELTHRRLVANAMQSGGWTPSWARHYFGDPAKADFLYSNGDIVSGADRRWITEPLPSDTERQRDRKLDHAVAWRSHKFVKRGEKP